MAGTWVVSTLLLTILAVSPATRAQQANAPSAEDQIRALDKEWANAEVAKDRIALERILDEGFVVTFSSGKTFDRGEFIDLILKVNMPPFNIVHDTIRINGDTAIIVDRFGDNLDTKCTWVAVKRNGQWRVIAEQMTKIKTDTSSSVPQPTAK